MVGQHCPDSPKKEHPFPTPFAECEAQLAEPTDGDPVGLALGVSVLSQQER